MSRDIRFPTMWYVWLAKAQTSLRIRAVWPEPLLVTWIFYDCKATEWTPFEVNKLKRRLHRLVWVYTCQNATLLEITCRGSCAMLKGRETNNTFIIPDFDCIDSWSLQPYLLLLFISISIINEMYLMSLLIYLAACNILALGWTCASAQSHSSFWVFEQHIVLFIGHS